MLGYFFALIFHAFSRKRRRSQKRKKKIKRYLRTIYWKTGIMFRSSRLFNKLAKKMFHRKFYWGMVWAVPSLLFCRKNYNIGRIGPSAKNINTPPSR